MVIQVEKSLCVICKILGRFANPLTADDKYSPLNRGNLFQYFEMQLCQKRKRFSLFFFFFFTFSIFRFNFEHFQKNDDHHR